MSARITFTLHELVAAMDGHADRILRERHGISMGDFLYLAPLQERQPLDITGLAQCLLVTKAAVSKRMPLLVAAGWVRVDAAPGEGRRRLITLTPAGEELVERAGSDLDAEFAALFHHPEAIAAGIGAGVGADRLNQQLDLLTRLLTLKETP